MQGPTNVAGQLPDRGNNWQGSQTGYNRFSCNFGFEQKYKKPALTVDQLFGNQDNYIIQSTDANPPVDIRITTEPTPSINELQNAASNTQTGPANTYTKYPGRSFGDSGVRDPYEVWDLDY